MQYVNDEINESFSPARFFTHRKCRIYLSENKMIHWHCGTNFSEIEIPDIDKIEYIIFYTSVPEFVSTDDFDNILDYVSKARFGVFDYNIGKYCYDSISGKIVINDRTNTPKKFRSLTNCIITQRNHGDDFRFSRFARANATVGAIAAEHYLDNNISFSISDFWHYHQEDNEVYWGEFLKPVEEMINNISLTEIEKMTAYLAWIYIGTLSECCHAENFTMTKLIFERCFKDNDNLHLFNKIWNIPNTSKDELIIDNNPINLLCIAIFSLIDTYRNYSPLDKDIFMKCLTETKNLTHNKPELAYAIIITGALAAEYYGKDTIPPEML